MLKAALLRITGEFSPAVLISGQRYHNHGHVLNIRLSDGLLRARVKGSSGQIYNVHIDLKTWPESGSRCSCKYQFKCKHAAACFFSLQAKEKLDVVKPLPALQSATLRGQDMMSPNLDEVIRADDLTWYSEYEERGHDFFAYQLGILVDGKSISIVPLVVSLLRRIDSKTMESMPDNKLMHLPIEQNKWLQIELGRIKPLLRLLLHYGVREGSQEPDIQMRRYQLALMQEAEQALRAT